MREQSFPPESWLAADPTPYTWGSARVSAARRFVEASLRDSGLPGEAVETAVLLTSDLVTNAVIHAAGNVEIRVIRGVGATVEVRDRSDRPPKARRHAEDSVSGRGPQRPKSLHSEAGCSDR